jgi:hypothetical protein
VRALRSPCAIGALSGLRSVVQAIMPSAAITPGGWDDAARAFCGSAWWRDPGFVDMRQSMTSGPDGRTCYYVTRSPPDRSPEAPSIQCVARRRDAAA